ncbi:hypothetical protein SAMN05216552_103494 [Pseudoduganella namucuonensis]|uniref:Uncharacterized protein n=1 Tax=Pseudoduganella namucuonensis TaxID=1035707 RepID=A0A1I7LQB4_9BURK|nr:hypothetical protein SAMN05216552_103494 [Pseudoduganella namucuonensis]
MKCKESNKEQARQASVAFMDHAWEDYLHW